MNQKGKGEGGSGAGKVFLILGIGCLILTAIGCGVGYYIMRNVRSLGADVARAALVKVVEETKLPEEQKTGVISHVDRVVVAFKDGDMTLEEVGKLFEKLGEGPLLPAGVLYYVHLGYVGKSDLSPEEKTAAIRIGQRYSRGAIEGQIPNSTTQRIIKMVQTSRRNAQGRTTTKLKDSLTPEEFKAFHEAIVAEVEAANIPDEPYQIDIAGEIGVIVDEALKNKK